MKRILIIGANGFVGKYLADEFGNDNYEVIVSDITPESKLNPKYKYQTIDILNKEKLEELISNVKPDFLVNLAAISSVGSSWAIPDKTIEVNVVGTLNILDAIRKNVPKCKVLLIGSSEEYEGKDTPLKETDTINANNPYGISKVAQENFAKLYKEKYGLNIVCTRSFNHTGIGQLDKFAIPSFCKQVAEIDETKKPGKIYVGNLSAYRDISDVRDIVKVYKALLEHETEELVYNVGSGKAHKMEDLLKYIISLASVPIEIVIDEAKIRPVDTPYICCDNSKTAQYFMGTDIQDTIKEMFEHYKKLIRGEMDR